MGRLSDILSNASENELLQNWNETKAADDFSPLPKGEYIAHIIAGELATSRTNNTPGYKLTFRVIEGEYAGRQFWHDVWLTPAAMSLAKRDLGKLGITDLNQLEQPLPRSFRCSVKLTLRREDDGSEFNSVRRFDVLCIDEPERDPFAPNDDCNNETVDDVAESQTELPNDSFDEPF